MFVIYLRSYLSFFPLHSTGEFFGSPTHNAPALFSHVRMHSFSVRICHIVEHQTACDGDIFFRVCAHAVPGRDCHQLRTESSSSCAPPPPPVHFFPRTRVPLVPRRGRCVPLWLWGAPRTQRAAGAMCSAACPRRRCFLSLVPTAVTATSFVVAWKIQGLIQFPLHRGVTSTGYAILF